MTERKVIDVVKLKRSKYVSGAGKEALFEEVEDGWLIKFEGTPIALKYEAPHNAPPNLKPGDTVALMKINEGGAPEPIAFSAPPPKPMDLGAAVAEDIAKVLVPAPDRSEPQIF